MNRIILTFSLVALAACSKGNTSSTVASEQGSAAPARAAFAFQASLGDVKAQAATPPAEGLWTNIELKYVVDCTESLDLFNYDVRARDDGGIDLFASAVGTRKLPQPNTFSCESIALDTKTVTVPGIVSASDVHLINLRGGEEPLLATTSGLAAIGLELVGVHSLCPVGAECEIGGTVVELKTTKGVSCVDKIAPVLQALGQPDAAGKTVLAVTAVDMLDSRAVACAAFPKTVEISLPMVFLGVDDIKLSVLGGN